MAMSRFALIAAVGVTAVLVGRVDAGRPLVATTEQTPLPDRESVLRSAASYLTQYEQAISAVVAEEDYVQQFQPPPFISTAGPSLPARWSAMRTLKSDLLVMTDPIYGWVTFRDVFEVDGKPVRDRDQRLAKLFTSPSVDAGQQGKAISEESARFNLNVPGVSVNRSINVPVAALLFLRDAAQRRSTFTVERVEMIDGRRTGVLAFEEQSLPRIIRSPSNQAMRGMAWIELASGRVLRTSLTFTLATVDAATAATIDVVYGPDPKSSLWLPVAMNESYKAVQSGQYAGVLTGKAKYSKFRRFTVDVAQERVDSDAFAPTK